MNTTTMATASHQQRIATRLARVTVLLLAATVLAGLAMHYWVFELFSHFIPLYAVGALLCAIALGLMGVWRWMLLALALALWNGYAPAQLLLGAAPTPVAPGHSGQFTVFHYNVGATHEQPSRVVSYLQRNARTIDVVVLLDISSDFAVALDDIREQFP
jgi:endonuclease/exonuclease/phosphatase (EEP) superfamily protein YafD